MATGEQSIHIDGKWLPSAGGAVYEVVNPATEEVIAKVADGGREDIQRAVAAARRAFDEGPWPKMAAQDRYRIIRQIADALSRRRNEITRILTAEAGAEQYLLGAQFDHPVATLYHFAEIALKHNFAEMFPEVIHTAMGPALGNTMVNYQPVSVCGLISTWNFPLYVTVQKVAPALATGSTMVLKAPPHTPLVNAELARAIEQSELPKGVFNLVTSSGAEAGEELVSSPQVDKISFTGSDSMRRR
jgi:aldehyde dehydrogenase (NAD+)